MISALLTMTLATTVALSIRPAGNTSGLPSRFNALKVDMCQLPCWLGIIPGETPLDEARQGLESAFADSPTYRISLIDSTSTLLRCWLVDRANESTLAVSIQITLDSIAINFPSSWDRSPTLADLYVWLGPPNEVQRPQRIQTGEYAYILFYGDETYRAAFYATSRSRLLFNESIDTILISAEHSMPSGANVNPPLMITVPWKGFSAISKYIAG
jgi:hypothetical protein